MTIIRILTVLLTTVILGASVQVSFAETRCWPEPFGGGVRCEGDQNITCYKVGQTLVCKPY